MNDRETGLRERVVREGKLIGRTLTRYSYYLMPDGWVYVVLSHTQCHNVAPKADFKALLAREPVSWDGKPDLALLD